MTWPELIQIAQAAGDTGVRLLVPLSTSREVNSPVGSVTNLNQYLSTVFKITIEIGALIAVLVIAYEGIRMISSNVPGLKNMAKSHLWDAMLGLGILLTAYLILYTINPCILQTQLNALGNGSPCSPSSAAPVSSGGQNNNPDAGPNPEAVDFTGGKMESANPQP